VPCVRIFVNLLETLLNDNTERHVRNSTVFVHYINDLRVLKDDAVLVSIDVVSLFAVFRDLEVRNGALKICQFCQKFSIISKNVITTFKPKCFRISSIFPTWSQTFQTKGKTSNRQSVQWKPVDSSCTCICALTAAGTWRRDGTSR